MNIVLTNVKNMNQTTKLARKMNIDMLRVKFYSKGNSILIDFLGQETAA